MIVKTGIVVITGDEIRAEGFVFDGISGKNADVDFLEWAIMRLVQQKHVQERIAKTPLLKLSDEKFGERLYIGGYRYETPED